MTAIATDWDLTTFEKLFRAVGKLKEANETVANSLRTLPTDYLGKPEYVDKLHQHIDNGVNLVETLCRWADSAKTTQHLPSDGEQDEMDKIFRALLDEYRFYSIYIKKFSLHHSLPMHGEISEAIYQGRERITRMNEIVESIDDEQYA